MAEQLERRTEGAPARFGGLEYAPAPEATDHVTIRSDHGLLLGGRLGEAPGPPRQAPSPHPPPPQGGGPGFRRAGVEKRRKADQGVPRRRPAPGRGPLL